MSDQQSKSGYAVRCSGCGAMYDADYSYCPYCGRMNDPAAEREYMEHLEELRQDVEELSVIPGQEAAKVAKSQGKKVLVIVIVTLCVIGLIAGVVFLRESMTLGQDDPKASYLWRQENIPKLDAYYEAGEYEEIMTLYQQAREEGHDFYSWEHADFAMTYHSCQSVCQAIQEREESFDPAEMSDYEYEDLFYQEVQILWQVKRANYLDEEEKGRLAEQVEIVQKDFDSVYALSEKQEAELWKTVDEDGFVSFTKTTELAEEWRQS